MQDTQTAPHCVKPNVMKMNTVYLVPCRYLNETGMTFAYLLRKESTQFKKKVLKDSKTSLALYSGLEHRAFKTSIEILCLLSKGSPGKRLAHFGVPN